MQSNRTLVVHAGGIGDFLLCCPALTALAHGGPIELAGRADRLELAVAGGLAEAAHDLEDMGFDSIFADPNERLRSFLRRFNRVVVWMKDDDGAIEGGLVRCGVGRVDVFPGLPPEDWTEHASTWYTRCLGLPDPEPFRLAIEPEGSLDVVIHPGSGGARKNWPFENYIALADRLTGAGHAVTWCGGPAEEGLALPPGAAVLCEPSLTGLARRVAGANRYVGNDSGITHLAAALGVPTFALFGPTDPAVWAPRGRHVTVLRGDPWPAIEDVYLSLVS